MAGQGILAKEANMARLSLALLGTFRAELDGLQLTGFESNKVRALLTYLAVESGRAHARESLAGLLWPDYSDRSAINNLRSALANLRNAIGDRLVDPPFLIITRATLQFNTASNYSLDISSLQNLSDLSIDGLEHTVSAYRGSFLEGFSLGDSPPFEEWALIKREQTNRQMLDALDRLAMHYEDCGEYDRSITYARRQLELEPWDENTHRQLMRLLALSGQRSAALAQYETCRQLMKQELHVAPARLTTGLYESIRDELFPSASAAHPGGLPLPKIEPPAPGEPPFKGLQYFSEEDADLFFGREVLIDRLISQVNECLSLAPGAARFLAVIGASGSGKSSIVRAGLIPALQRGHLLLVPGSADRLPPFNGAVHLITPTARPLEALAASLTRTVASVGATATLIDDLARDPRSLHLAALRLPQLPVGPYLLIVVDQFEELFSLCHNPAERKAFVDNLLYAAESPGPTMVVIALRADFYSFCAPFDNLRQALCQRQVYLGGMNSAELRRAIEEPALRAGWILEPGLVDLLLREVGDEPGALPLLSHALLETWQRRRGRTLTLAGYSDSGGVRGALAKTAETTFNLFTPDQQYLARHIFLRLTELGEGGQDTRRRTALDELAPPTEDALQVQTVLKKLADARLITTTLDSVEVAHEALIREWSRLRFWLNEDRDGLRLHRHLTQAAQEWDRLDRDSGMLYRGARLAQALEWLETNPTALNGLEQDFLAASLAEQQAQHAAELARQQRELEAAQALAEAQRQRAEAEGRRAGEQLQAARQARRNAIILALALGFSVVLLVVAVWLGGLANRNAQAAREQTRLATSRELAAAAVNNLQVDPERSVLLALQALSTAQTLEASNALHQALPELHILYTIPAHRQTTGLAFSLDGTRLATIGVDGEAKVWDSATYQLLLTLPGAPGDVVNTNIIYSPDGKLLATSTTKKLIIWDALTGQKLFELAGELSGPQLNYMSFSPDGKRLAVANMDGMPKVWDLTNRSVVQTLSGHAQICDSLAYSPDGKLLASGDEAGTVKIWDAASGHELLMFNVGGIIGSLAFSPDSTRLAVTNEDGLIKLWDPVAGKELHSLPRTVGVYGVAFMRDGLWLATVHQDGTTNVWDAATGEKVMTLAGHTSTVLGIAVSPDSKRLATAGYDGTVKIWDAGPGREQLTLAPYAGPLYAGTYSPDGKRLGTAGQDGKARVWDPQSGKILLELSRAGAAGTLTSLAFSPDGRRLAAGDGNGFVQVWDLDAVQIILILSAHSLPVYGAAFSPDGGRLATTSWDGTSKVWDLASGDLLASFTGHTGMVFGLAFSPDGKHLFTSGEQNVRMWDAGTGQEMRSFSGDGKDVYGVALSRDGSLLAMGRQDGVATVWDVSSGRQLRALSGHAGLILGLAFSADGTRLATGSFDKYAKVWDVQTGQELATLYGNTSNVFAVSFSPDGLSLATAGGDGMERIYTLNVDAMVKLANSRLTRALTADECHKYLHLEQCPLNNP
jgi:WD40 repeat protein/DNA-binding SARP family transcriptional activator